MESDSHAKDVAALLSRAGLKGSGNYREFLRKPADVKRDAKITADSSVADVKPSEFTLRKTSSMSTSKDLGCSVDQLFRSSKLHSVKRRQIAVQIALFSLAGGVGKTTLAMTIGRAVSARMKRVVLANYDSNFGMDHLRGSHRQILGPLSFIHAPNPTSAPPLTLIEGGENAPADQRQTALQLLAELTPQVEMILMDLPSNRSAQTIENLRAADHIMIPLTPDMHSAMTLQPLQEFIVRERLDGNKIHYVINRYDHSRSEHRDMRDRLQSTLGGSLLPFAINEEPLIQDAMRSGVTVMDYAPDSESVVILEALGKWAEHLRPCADVGRGRTA